MTSLQQASDSDGSPAPAVLPFADLRAVDPVLCGGKASALARLAQAGFPVPDGFVVTTAAFRRFHPPAADAGKAALPPELADEMAVAYRELGAPPVAVRSSASGEDSAERSFAGQYESLLDVTGLPALFDALLACWTSLSGSSVVAYRAKQAADGRADPAADDVAPAMAVVVQRMVAAECAGVLFTADPVSGSRRRMTIEAVPGLGDELMAGGAEPHRFVAELGDGEGDDSNHRAPSLRLVHRPAGAPPEAVPMAAVAAAVALGARVAAAIGSPQDIEWAWCDGAVHLLQSRPITTLYPLPEARPHARSGSGLLVSFGAIQGMLDPMTPLGRDTIRGLFAGAAGLFGRRVTWRDEPVMATAGERLWLDVGGLAASVLGRRILRGALGLIEPGVGQAVGTAISATPPSRRLPYPSSLWRFARVAIPIFVRALTALLAPGWSRDRAQHWLDRLVGDRPEQPVAATLSVHEPLARLAEVWRRAFPTIVRHLLPRVAAGVVCQRVLARLCRGVPGAEQADRTAARGLPGNPTTAMNRRLWLIAEQARASPASAAAFDGASAAELAAGFGRGRLPAELQQGLEGFLNAYGARGEGEIDLGRRRWREDPTPLFQTLLAYSRTTRDAPPPPGVDRRRDEQELAERAAAWQQALARAGRGPLQRWLLRRVLHRFRTLGGLRESPKLAVMRLLGPVRWQLLASADALVDDGVLKDREEVFLLHVDELVELAAGTGEVESWRGLVAARRDARRHELARRRVPLVLLGDGESIYAGAALDDAALAGAASAGSVLAGTPVSPGVVVGSVRVMTSPADGVLEPGEVLVCRATDPAWTPLFLTAAALVTEVGGLMTHGSVVAREHGIPAVVGVAGATERLRAGQRLRVDGATGRLEVLDDAEPSKPG